LNVSELLGRMNEVADRNNVLKLENDTLQQTVRQVTTPSLVAMYKCTV